jgi:hypothetical protein
MHAIPLPFVLTEDANTYFTTHFGFEVLGYLINDGMSHDSVINSLLPYIHYLY